MLPEWIEPSIELGEYIQEHVYNLAEEYSDFNTHKITDKE